MSNNNPPRRRRSLLVWVVLAAGAAVIAAALVWRERDRPKPPAQPPPPQADVAPATAEPATTNRTSAFKRLEGKWHRADGDYVIDIRRSEADGRLDAAYLNPSPIHVTQASAKIDHGLVQVFVELRDRGYPGCTYNLVYDAGNDCLAGTYFQAAQGETYSVIFTRMRP